VTNDSEQTHNRVAAAHRTALTLVVALAMSIVIYTGVGLLILNLRPAGPQAGLPYSFYAAAAVLAIGSILLRRAQLHRMKLEVVAGTRGVDGLIKHLLNATILAAAIAEVIGVLALVVAFFGGDQSDVIRLGVVALAVSLYNYPRQSAWQRAVDYFAATNADASKSELGL
jgi:formate-dependent nitrite reductase membrane component NrfD